MGKRDETPVVFMAADPAPVGPLARIKGTEPSVTVRVLGRYRVVWEQVRTAGDVFTAPAGVVADWELHGYVERVTIE